VRSYFKVVFIFLILIATWPGPGEAKECLPLTEGLAQLSLLENNTTARFAKEVSPSQVSRLTVLKTRLRPSQLSYSKLRPFKGRNILEIDEKMKGLEIASIERFHSPFSSNKLFKVTLSDGTVGIWKPHTEAWKSNYRTEVLAYEVDQLFGFNRVPPTVERTIDGKKGSLQLFKESKIGLADKEEYDRLQFFDWIIDNRDRHGGDYDYKLNKWNQGPNRLTAPDNKLVAIDNGLSFMDKGEAYPFKVRKEAIDKFLATSEGKE
jgi:hypothetical protein